MKGDYMCSIIGTCLTLAELRRLARKNGCRESELNDYDLHGLMVGMCKVRSEITRNVHKFLERKHAGAIRQARVAKTPEALREHWKQAIESGHAAGAYWALMSHGAATPELVVEAFGDVHMLSHLLGASRHVDQQQLEQAVAKAEAEKRHASDLQGLLRQERAALVEARDRVRALEASEARWRDEVAEQRARGAASSSARELDALRIEVEKLRAQLSEERELRATADRLGKKLEAALREAEGRVEDLSTERDALALESAAAEAQIDVLLSELQLDEECRTCPARFDLAGMCVLYVGGRQGLVRHYREMVQRRGGRFIHHDGGLEDQKARLDVLVHSAGVVLCPIDAVSHDACLRVKKACRRGARPFVPLRTSGVASLAAALHALRMPQ